MQRLICRSIESEEDQDYLLEQVLLKRFAILVDGTESTSVNAVEKAVDIHALKASLGPALGTLRSLCLIRS